MARMRLAKQRLRTWLEEETWRTHLDAIAQGGLELVGPLFSFLPQAPCTMHRAAVALGCLTARLERDQPEAAKNILRRLMWHLNEESGNMGWGIPEAFGEILVASEPVARMFHRVLISYIIDLGRDDNYCDNDILRRSCYWAIGRCAQERQELFLSARPWLRRGLTDQDAVCCGMAAWALGQLPRDLMDAPGLRHLAESGSTAVCALFDGNHIYEITAVQAATDALGKP